MNRTITIASEADLERAAGEFVSLMGDETVYAFNGPMGAGKPRLSGLWCVPSA